MNKSLIEKIDSVGLTYQQYLDLIRKEVEVTASVVLTNQEKKPFDEQKLNLHRMTRIEKHYGVSAELKNLILRVDRRQTWMIISETWCGDSAQNIPYIAKIASLNPQIDLQIILRDIYPHIMDMYLTNGTRSIPILVAYDEFGNELFRWGPRPHEAKKLFANLKAQGLKMPAILERLHLWYGRNRGKNLEAEMGEAIRKTLLTPH